MIEKCLGSSISTTIHLDNALNIFHGDCTSNADLLPYPALIATNLDSSNQFKRVRSTLILCVPLQVHSLSREPSRFCCDVEQHWRNKLFVAAVTVSSLVRSDSSRQPVGLLFSVSLRRDCKRKFGLLLFNSYCSDAQIYVTDIRVRL